MKHSNKFIPWITLLLILLLVMPAFAQGDDDAAGIEIEFVGSVVEISAKSITIDGYTLAIPEDVAVPRLAIGDEVIIAGLLNLDDNSLTLTGIRLAPPPDADDTGVDNGDVDEDGSPGNSDNNGNNGRGDDDDLDDDLDDDDVDEDENDEGEGDEDEDLLIFCDPDHNPHPVLRALAATFDLEYMILAEWHCHGLGVGDISKALILEARTGTSAASILARVSDGEAWGDILREFDIRPNMLAPGQIISNVPPGQQQDDDGSPGNSGNAPGQQQSDDGSPGNSGNAPGQQQSDDGSPGNSGNAPGQQQSDDGSPGNSGNAPGQNNSSNNGNNGRGNGRGN